MIHDTRVIPLDNRPHIASSIKQYMGDGRGRWEGDTLVVETTNFTDKTSFSGLHSDQLKLTEWFTRIDPEMIDYRIRVEDPETWTAPFTVRLTITQQPNYQLYRVLVPRGQRRGRLRAERRARVRADGRRGQGQGTADSASHDGDGSVFGRSGRGTTAGPGAGWREVAHQAVTRGHARHVARSRRRVSLPEVRRHRGAADAATGHAWERT